MSKTIIGNIHIVSLDPAIGEIEQGYIVIEDGKILEVGRKEDLDIPFDTEDASGVDYLDGEGAFAYPGFIDAHNHLGMFDDHLGWEGSDGNESTNPVTPELRAIDSIFHDDVTLEEAIEGGITTVMTGPGSANVIGGQFAVIKPYGRTVDEMVVQAPAAMKAALGDNPKRVYGQNHQRPRTRMGNAAVLREALIKAQRYQQAQNQSLTNGQSEPKLDLQSEALLPVLEREMVLKIHCHRADDILTAIRIANEFSIRYTLDHCTEGYLIADVLAQEYQKRDEDGHGTLEGIICGPLLSGRSKPEQTRMWNGLPAVLYETGIPMALATDHPVIPIQYGPAQAALMMKEGLSRQAALDAITTAPAKILGLDDRIGRLAPGLDADIVLWEEDPFSPSAVTTKVFIDGQLVYEI